jgi:DNA-binding transcriptional ArsR family regulator
MKDLMLKIEDGAYEFKEPWRATGKSLTIIVPIVARKAETRGYVVLEEVKDKVLIEDTGRIGEAKITGNVDKPTFVPGGTMLKGATQARATQFGLVVIPQKTEQVLVHCIHASRGIRPGATFTPAGRTPHKVYSYMLAYRSQSHTWNAVSHYSAMALSETPQVTVAADDLVGIVEETQRFREDLKQLLKGIPSYINQTGVAIIDHDGVLGLEMYDHPDSWKAFSESIIQSYLEALAREDKTGIFKIDLEAAVNALKAFIEEIKKAEGEEVFNKNNARTVILKAEGYVGEYTTLNGKTIHLLIIRKEKETIKPQPTAPIPYRYRETARRTRYPAYGITAPSETSIFYTTSIPNHWAENWKKKMRKDIATEVLNALKQPKTWTSLTSELQMSKATLSSHLKNLQQLGVVEKHRDENGVTRYYTTGLGQELKKKRHLS